MGYARRTPTLTAGPTQRVCRLCRPFTDHTLPVRVITIDGEPWFVAAEVAKVLGIAAANGITRMIDDEDKAYHEVITPGGPQTVTIVNESGLYTALIRSDKPEATKFRRWVTSEVLPTIRKTGSYSVPAKLRRRSPASFTPPCSATPRRPTWPNWI